MRPLVQHLLPTGSGAPAACSRRSLPFLRRRPLEAARRNRIRSTFLKEGPDPGKLSTQSGRASARFLKGCQGLPHTLLTTWSSHRALSKQCAWEGSRVLPRTGAFYPNSLASKLLAFCSTGCCLLSTRKRTQNGLQNGHQNGHKRPGRFGCHLGDPKGVGSMPET